MKLRSLLPRRWREAPTAVPLAVKPSNRAWRLEALEPRMLLSADPVLGAVHLALAPVDPDVGDPLEHAYVPEPAGPTMRALAVTLPSGGQTSPIIVSSGNYSFANDSMQVSGDLLIQTTDTSAGNGSISIGSFNHGDKLSGNSSATTDNLTLSAARNITINAEVNVGGGSTDLLSSLTILTAKDVTFKEAVAINGSLIIDATGTVTFERGISLGSGGSLIIRGAAQLVLSSPLALSQGSAVSAGNIVLEADEINLQMSAEQITGTGAVTLRPATLATPMALFSPAGAATSGVLNLENSELAAFAAGFSSFTFGHVSGGHAQSGAGAVLVGASTAPDSLVLQDAVAIYGGSITVTDFSDPNAMLRLGAGDRLTLDAYADITLQNAVEADHLTLASATGKIQQTDSNVDGRASEALRALSLTATAATGVNLQSLEINQLDVVNSGIGNIVLNENAARSTSRFSDVAIDGTVTLLQLAQTGLSGSNGISLTSHAGTGVDSSVRPGNITLAAGAGISLATDGALSLSALGAGSDISLLAAIAVKGGAVTLSAADALTSNASAPLSASGASAISFISGTGALTLGAAVTTVGGSLTLSSGAALDLSGITLSAGASGAIALQSAGDLKVGVISAASSIALTSTGGAIVDALTGNAANLVGEAAVATLSAANGVGTGSAPLRTAVGSLTASVSGASGGIFIAEDTALTVTSGGLTTAGSGPIVLRNSAGDLTTLGAVQASGSGHILLESVVGALAVQASVVAQAGSISLLAGAALGVTGPEVRTRGASQTLDLRAGTSLASDAATVLATAGGAVRLQGASVTLSQVEAGAGSVAVIGGFSVAGTAGNSLTAQALRLQSGGAIGSAATPLSLNVAQLAASAAGLVVLNEANDLSIASIADPAVNRVGVLGTVSALTPSSALAGLVNAGGTSVLNAGGALTLNAVASATGHLRLSAGTALNLNAGVSSTGGQLTLLAGGTINHSATGLLQTSGGAIDEQAGGAISYASGASALSSGGQLRLQSGGVLTVDRLDAGNGEAWLQGASILAASGSSAVNLSASQARLIATGTAAGDGIGLGSDPLSLSLLRLAAQSAGGAGVFLAESDGVSVDSLAASVGSRVQADGGVAALPADAALSGLSGPSAAVVLSSAGDLTVLAGVNAQRASLWAGNDLNLQAPVSTSGALSLEALRDLNLQAALSSGAGIDLLAARDLLMSAGVQATAQGASLLQAGRDVRVAAVDVGSTRSLTLVASGSVSDADAAGDSSVNLQAGKLVFSVGGSIGAAGNAIETTATYLGASAGGSVFIDETDALIIPAALATSFGTVQRVQVNGNLANPTVADVQGLASGNAPLVLRLLGGALTVDAAVQTGGGALRLEASGAMALNAAVSSTGGALSLLAGAAMSQTAAGIVRSSGGAIDAQSGGSWTQAQGSRLASGGGALRLSAGGALALAQLDAGTGAMSLTASQVKDLAGDLDAQADLIAASLSLRTTGTAASDGVGSGTDPIETAVQRLAASTAGGGLFLSQLSGVSSGALTADSLAAFAGTRVQVDGTVASGAVSDAALAGLSSAASLVLIGAGTVTLNAATSAASSLLITSPSTLSVGAPLSGLIVSLSAGHDLLLNANVSSNGSARSLDLVATRDIVQAQGASLTTVNGAIVLQAGRDLTLETLSAGTAGAALVAGGAIVDGDAPGDSETDISASSLRLTAGGAAGSAANALETAVSTLSASAASLSLAQTQGLGIDRVSTSFQRVASSGNLVGVELAPQEDLTSSSGALLLSLASGDLTINGGTASAEQGVSAGGALLLRAVTGSVAVKAGITAAGATSLRAGGDLSFTASGDITLAGAASLDAEAGASLTMADGSVFTSGSGALRLSAVLNLAVGALQTGGDVSLLARNITDAGGAETDVTARALRVQTTGTGTTQGFGSGALPLQLQVATLAAQVAGTGAGGFFAKEADALAIDTVAVSVARVAADGSQATLADAALSDLVSGGNVVLVTGGSLSLADGANADGTALTAAGNVLLDVSGDLSQTAALRSTSGAISLLATGTMALGADVAITRTGRTLDVQAGGALTMAAAANLSVVDSAVRVQAGGSLTVAGILAGLGQVSLISTGGSILAATGHAGPELSAASLRLNAAVGVGSSGDRLDIAAQRVSARAAAGGIWLQEADAITIADVAVSVRRVSTLAGTTATVDDATQSDLVTTGGNGSIALATVNGSINFADGTAPGDGRSVTAHGTGSVSLKAGGVGAVVNAPAGAIEQQGPVVIDSGLKFDGTLSLTGGQGGGRGDGPVTIGGAIDGTAGGAADTLVISSDGADVVFGGSIGATERLGALTINDARDVRFDADVKLAGNLTLQAAGRVEFKGGLDLSSGSLSIVGATELVIGNVVISSGNALIRVDALTLSGLITGSAAATLELSGAAGGVDVGGSGAGLALSGAQLAALRGFGNVQIGRTQAATAVSVAALNSLSTPHLTLAGSSLSLQGGSTAVNAALTLLDLTASQDLTLAGALTLTAAGADVRGSAGGALRMATDGALLTQAGDVQLQAAGDLRVGRIDTRASAGGATAAVVLASTSGTISEANADIAADIYADLLTLRGRGPALGAGASETPAALDVQANRLDVDAPSGVVLRDGASNGRTAFNLMDGGQIYQQLMALGAPPRQASQAAGPTQQPTAAEAWAWLNTVRPLQDTRDTTLAGAAPAPGTFSTLLAVPVREVTASAMFAADPAPLLPTALAALLQLDPAAAQAEPASDAARFRVWSEELVL